MKNEEELIDQIKLLCLAVTEDTYKTVVQKGYELLSRACDLGLEKEKIYPSLFQYYNNLEESLSRDCIADILDFVVGWCSSQNWIWRDS